MITQKGPVNSFHLTDPDIQPTELDRLVDFTFTELLDDLLQVYREFPCDLVILSRKAIRACRIREKIEDGLPLLPKESSICGATVLEIGIPLLKKDVYRTQRLRPWLGLHYIKIFSTEIYLGFL